MKPFNPFDDYMRGVQCEAEAALRRLDAACAPKPALPRLPADLLRECAEAAGIATAHTEEKP